MTASISRYNLNRWQSHDFFFFMSLNIMDHTIPLHQFRLKDGVRKVPHYGLLLAKVAGLPSSVIDTAASITSRITEQVNLSVLIRADLITQCVWLLRLHYATQIVCPFSSTWVLFFFDCTALLVPAAGFDFFYSSALIKSSLPVLIPACRKWWGRTTTASSTGRSRWRTRSRNGSSAWSNPTKAITTSGKRCRISRTAMLQAAWHEKKNICKKEFLFLFLLKLAACMDYGRTDVAM